MRLSTFHSFSKFVAFLMQMDILLVLVIAAAKSLQSCPTLCDPIDGSPPGSLSLGFSRQEHWSGLPFPSPMHESEKWKGSCSVVSDPQRPHGLQPTRLLHPWDLPGKSTGVGCHCSSDYFIPFISESTIRSAVDRIRILITSTHWVLTMCQLLSTVCVLTYLVLITTPGV